MLLRQILPKVLDWLYNLPGISSLWSIFRQGQASTPFWSEEEKEQQLYRVLPI
jgi:hypothetical protein